MNFLMLIVAFSVFAYIPQFFFKQHRKDYRIALRHGMACGFVVAGIDHFIHLHDKYVPMLPDFFADYAVSLVYFTGAAEIVGAIGLVIPLAVYRRFRLPNLRRWVGMGYAVMLALVVVANINLAVHAARSPELASSRWYYLLRPFLQPIFIIWALFVSGVIWSKDTK